jgi:hypothetical protein
VVFLVAAGALLLSAISWLFVRRDDDGREVA